MKRTNFKSALFVIAGVLLLQTAALAGPPLLCHPFNVGDAKSLPFQGPAWSQIDPAYNVNNLIDDTVSLLAIDTPVIVRMETLRRATLYSRNDAKLAAALFQRIKERADRFSPDSNSRDAALAWFDLGYLAETYKQAAAISRIVQPHDKAFWSFDQVNPNVDGYALVERAISKGGGAEMEFAAAMMASSKRGPDYFTHLRNASAAVKPGSLLSQNLESHFAEDMKVARLK